MFSLLKNSSTTLVALARTRGRLAAFRGMASAEASETVKEIQELIRDKIRPSIQEHGGDLEFVSYENKIVKVKLQGACSSCPSSIVTLKSGVKNMLQYYVPEVEDVEEVLEDQNP